MTGSAPAPRGPSMIVLEGVEPSQQDYERLDDAGCRGVFGEQCSSRAAVVLKVIGSNGCVLIALCRDHERMAIAALEALDCKEHLN